MTELMMDDHLRAHWPADVDRTVLEHPDGRRRSYGWLIDRSARVARALQDLEVPVGGRVAVQVDKTEDMLPVYLGCLRAGAALLPLNPAYTAD